MTTLKGAVVAPLASADDVKALLDTGATLVRYQIPWNALGFAYTSDEIYDLFKTDKKAILDVHQYDPKYPKDILNEWKRRIDYPRNKSNNIIFGVANEPSFPQYPHLCKEVIKYASHNAPINPLAVTCPYSDPLQFGKTVYYPNRPIYYEVHMYLPFKFTHQGVYPQYPVGQKYPTATLNKEKLKSYLKKVRAFQLKNKAPILVGEFSCSIYADPESRYNYLKDCINIFDEYGWHWCYHAWREASVWDIESDPKIYKLLTEAWSR